MTDRNFKPGTFQGAGSGELEAQIAELKANRDAWVKAGMLGKIERCGTRSRLCIQVDEGAGAFGEHLEYRVIQGY